MDAPKRPEQKQSVTSERKNISDLYKALREGDLESVRHLLHQQPSLLDAKLSQYRETALHIAIRAGHVKIAKELVRSSPPESLTKMTGQGETSLTLAAAGGITDVAKFLVAKNIDLVGMENLLGDIPVVVAAQFGHKEMVHFLYSMTQEKDHLNPKSSKHGVRLLTICISTQIFDIALRMVKLYPELAIAVLKDSEVEPLNQLARHSAFGSASDFAVRPQSYSCRLLQSVQSSCKILARRFTHGNSRFSGWNFLNYIPFVKHIYKTKLEHAQVRELFSYIYKQLWNFPERRRAKILRKPVLVAVLHGNVGFVAEVAKTNPDLVCVDKFEGRTLFSYAISERQEEVFCFLRQMGAMQRGLAAMRDDDGTSILQHATKLPPSHVLGRISGAALQMQKELQWIKEVETIAPVFKQLNNEGKTLREIFTEKHQPLVKEGEKWMKETATACTVVAALIVTMMFAAAFTVPGGYDGVTGIPIYLHSNYFVIFIVSDALSLFFSSISVLVFLVILTSLYREEDFLISLPAKLMLGLSTLSFSIAAMMMTFGAAIVMMLRERFLWILLPIVMLASIPVILFVLLQFPVFVHIYRSIYGTQIFGRGKE